MKEIALAILSQNLSNLQTWTSNEAVSDLLHFVYEGGIWDSDFLEKKDNLLKKKISTLTEQEIYTYLTIIISGDRINEGLYDDKIADGTIAALMKRYLEVIE